MKGSIVTGELELLPNIEVLIAKNFGPMQMSTRSRPRILTEKNHLQTTPRSATSKALYKIECKIREFIH